MPFQVFCYLGQNTWNKQNKIVANHSLSDNKTADQDNSASAANLILPLTCGKDPQRVFQSVFGTIVSFI